tara:strand:- start:254 stop:793 length:540 start_codon:yes stop_codon:yes gene_type:complete
MTLRPDPEETFVQLVVTHQAALRAFVLSLMPGSQEVEDVIQETNAAIWRKRGEFQIGTSFKSWMFSVAKFKAMSSWRDRSRRKEWVLPEETMIKLIEEVETGGFETTEEKQEALRLCLQQLRPEDRGLILRRYIKESSLGELAKETGRNKESLKVSLHRLRVLLKTCVLRKLKVQEARS